MRNILIMTGDVLILIDSLIYEFHRVTKAFDRRQANKTQKVEGEESLNANFFGVSARRMKINHPGDDEFTAETMETLQTFDMAGKKGQRCLKNISPAGVFHTNRHERVM